MNFATEKMAKGLEFPNKQYLVELKKKRPTLFLKLQAEYDAGFSKFFGEMVNRIKMLLKANLDVKQFIEQCQKEFESRNEFEKSLVVKEEVEMISSDSEHGGKTYRVHPSGTVNQELVLLKTKYETLQSDYENLNTRYSQTKMLLTEQLQLNQKLVHENESLKKNCVCQSIEQMILKRKR